ncbi:hypothetical protein RQP46_008010 [Phenoliferia psychrophenolica]
MPPRPVLLLLCALCVLACIPSASAFGSGNIPESSYLKGKAWRHGEIEDTLASLAKVAGGSGGAILGAIAGALLGGGGGGGSNGGKRFSGLDVKRVYFGNWLRDLSQVCDIAGFKAMTADSLVIVIMTLGFMSFGYATGEFEVTKDRLSVYSLSEHLDNPKGYGEGQDPRTYDSRLRPPVEDRELEIDQRNGMKKYLATENEGFETGTATIRRFLKRAIELCREGRRENNKDKEYEAFRLLGTGLHTLEDFSAHSNWCELALRKLGNKDVFPHVGDNVKVRSPSGEEVAPLVTGTFGGADFMHSMLGEAGDKLSQSSIADLTSKMDDAQAKNQQGGKLKFLKGLLAQMPSSGGQDNGAKLDEIEQKKKSFDLDGSIDQLAPEELQKQLWSIFKIHIEETIESIPGLSQLLDNLSTALMEFVLVNVDPFVRPLLIQATTVIGEGSKAVIAGADQWEVFTNPNASDPTHSVIAKDHFSNILNDPAGRISCVIVKHTVELIVEAWSNDENPDEVINKVLEAMHHPDFASGNSQVQRDMMECMETWLSEMDSDDRQTTINSLSKDGVRNHRNQRKVSENDEDPRIVGGQPHSHGPSPASHQQQQSSSYTPSYDRPSQQQQQQQQSTFNPSYEQQQQQQSSYNRPDADTNSGGRTYHSDRPSQQSSYNSGRQDDEPIRGGNYGGGGQSFEDRSSQSQSQSYGQERERPYGGGGQQRQDDRAPQGGAYGREPPRGENFGGFEQPPRQSDRRHDESFEQPRFGSEGEQPRFGGGDDNRGGYDGGRQGGGSHGQSRDHESFGQGGGGGGRREGDFGGGRREHEQDETRRHHGGRGGDDDESRGHHGLRSSRGGDDDNEGRGEGGYGRRGGQREENRYD